MKKIEAIVPHGRLDKTFEGLKQLQLGGFTYYEAKGRGQAPRVKVIAEEEQQAIQQRLT